MNQLTSILLPGGVGRQAVSLVAQRVRREPVALFRRLAGAVVIAWLVERFLATGFALGVDAQEHAQGDADGEGEEDEVDDEPDRHGEG